MGALKASYKAKYACTGKKPVAAVKKAQEEAQAKFKQVAKSYASFRKSSRKAHHHARNLKKGLKHAIHKLHFVFGKARHMYRHTISSFRLGSKCTWRHTGSSIPRPLLC